MRSSRIKWIILLLALQIGLLGAIQLAYGFLWAYDFQTLAMLFELVIAMLGLLFGVFAIATLIAWRWDIALASMLLPIVAACYFQFDKFDLIPQSIDLADSVRFELSAQRYIKEAEAEAGPVGARLAIWPWREFAFAPAQPWFVQLVYDESDGLLRNRNERSPNWQDRVVTKDRLFAQCSESTRLLRRHFYLVTLTC